MRMFGWMKLVSVEKYENEIKKQAPDVVDSHFTKEYLAKVFSKSGRAVKLVLMDQEKIGGVGNIYANDALYLAGVMPSRKAKSLTSAETEKIFDATCKVIALGIECGGASAANYVDTKGLGGSYQEHFLTYKQDGKICKKCGSIIKKMKLGGRGTFYCVGCQN
jgi:formamidopyrimidine-DNA glycosylase